MPAHEQKAFLVLGAESTGTRMVTRLLLASGCYGDGDHEQRLDAEVWEDLPLFPVWRRSFPHFGGAQRIWPSVPAMTDRFRSHAREVHAVVTMRDWTAATVSQVSEQPMYGLSHVPSEKIALANLQEAYIRIFSGLAAANVPFTIVSYESLTTNPQAVRQFVQSLGLVYGKHEELFDGNRKTAYRIKL